MPSIQSALELNSKYFTKSHISKLPKSKKGNLNDWQSTKELLKSRGIALNKRQTGDFGINQFVRKYSRKIEIKRQTGGLGKNQSVRYILGSRMILC